MARQQVQIARDKTGTLWHVNPASVKLPGATGSATNYPLAELWAVGDYISFRWASNEFQAVAHFGTIRPYLKHFIPTFGVAFGGLPIAAGGRWHLVGNQSASVINSVLGRSLFTSADQESDGKVDLSKFSFGLDFGDVEKRPLWNQANLDPARYYSPSDDVFEATSPFRHLIVTANTLGANHENYIANKAFLASEEFIIFNADPGKVMNTHYHGRPEEPWTNLTSSTAQFQIRFVVPNTSGQFPATHSVIPDPFPWDAVLVIATGTVTHDPLTINDVAPVTVGANNVFKVTVRNVQGGPSGGLLGIALRADKQIYGAGTNQVYSRIPPRIPAKYQEYYQVPPSP